GCLEERGAPVGGGRRVVRLLTHRLLDDAARDAAAVLLGDRHRAIDPRVARMIGRLEAEDEYVRALLVARTGDEVQRRLLRVEHAAVGGVKTGLRDPPRREHLVVEARKV